jgi:hypothetical protein
MGVVAYRALRNDKGSLKLFALKVTKTFGKTSQLLAERK